MSEAPGPERPAPPRGPRLPAELGATPAGELDPDYPDLDGVGVTGASLAFDDARTLSVLRSRLVGCQLDVDPSVPIDLVDSVLADVDLTGRRVRAAERVRLEGCRLGGADLRDARIRDVTFDDCVLDLASWRSADVERVSISGGRVDGLDLSGARLTDVCVSGVVLTDVVLDGVRAERVDLSGADLSPVLDVAALRGCTISVEQAVALAARAARALGLHLRTDDWDQDRIRR